MYLTCLVCFFAILGSYTVLSTLDGYDEVIRVRRRVPPLISARQFPAAQCEPGANGLFAHPYNCAQFLNCNHGQTFVQDCGPGTMFNDLIKVCDWPHNVDCTARGPGVFVNNELQPDEIIQGNPTYIYPMDVRSGFDSQPLASSDTRTQRKYYVADDNTHGSEHFISPNYQYPYQQYPTIPLTPQTRTVEIQLPDQDFFDESMLLPIPVLSSRVDNVDGNGLVNNDNENIAKTYKQHRTNANSPQSNMNRNRIDSSTPEATINSLPARQNPPALNNRNNMEDQYPQLNYLSRRVVNEFDKVFSHSQATTTTTTTTTTSAPTTTKQVRTSPTTKASRVKMVYPYGFEEVGAKCEETGFDLHPHPFDCTKYMTCEDGVIRMHSCKNGFMFNPTLKICDYTRNVAKCQLKPPNLYKSPKSIADEINEIHDDGGRREKMDELSRIQPVGKMPQKPATDLLPPELPTFLLPPKPTAPQDFTGYAPTGAAAATETPRTFFIPDMAVLPLSSEPRPKYPNDNQLKKSYTNTNPTKASHTPPQTLNEIDQQIEGIKTRIAAEENITIEANKPNVQIPQGKEHVMPIYQRPSRKLEPSTTTTTGKPAISYNPVQYEPFSQPANETEQDYVPISEALKLLLQPYLTRSNSTNHTKHDNDLEHMNNIENKLMDMMDNGQDSRSPQIKPLEQDSLAAAELHERNKFGKTPTSHLITDVEEIISSQNEHKHNHSPRSDASKQYQPQFHTRFDDDVENVLTNSNTDRTTNNNQQHHYPSNSHHHPTPNKHANHLGAHDSKQGPNYRSNAPPANINSIFANGNKEATLHEEGFLCQFDCHNGKCITFDQLCDGKNDCGNRYDEHSCPHINYQVRLSNDHGHKHLGRVEVRAFGKWGYVCDDQFTTIEANVLCRELGFNMGAAEVKTNSFYPPNANMPSDESMFLMDNVQCKGNETSLKDCDFNGWGVSDCTPENVVGVVCKTTIMQCPPNHWLCQESEECIPWNFMCDNIKDCTDGTDESDMHCQAKIEYRLTGGSELGGRVEVKYRGMWGTVCDDDFGAQEARVLCRSLGFYGPAAVIKSGFGPGTGPIWLDQVNCEGNETSIDKCMHHEWSQTNCNHTEDVAVRCSYGPDGKSGKYISAGMELQRLTNRQTHDYSRTLDLSSENTPDFSNTCGQVKVTGDDESEEKFERFRVIGGSRAKRGHHPWQATIRTRTKYGSMHWCGAVIISEKHILTAAHCLVGFPTGAYVVRVGDHHSDVYEKSEWETFIEKWFIHEDFRKDQRMNNDIAVIELKQPIQFTNYIQPICLPERETIYEAGRNCTISGWGTIQYGKSTPSNDLKAATVPLIAQQICRRKDVYGDEIMNTMFCAGFMNKTGIDACDGDSGGPLVCADDFGVHSLYGVISWGQRCGDATKPGVYVKITEYLDWIKEKMAILH